MASKLKRISKKSGEPKKSLKEKRELRERV